MNFIYIGNSEVQIRGLGKASGFGDPIELPETMADAWRERGGPVVIPEDKYEDLGKDQAACLEFIEVVRSKVPKDPEPQAVPVESPAAAAPTEPEVF